MTPKTIREATRALLLGSGALYGVATPAQEAAACYYCNYGGGTLCAWDAYQGYVTCFTTVTEAGYTCNWEAHNWGCLPF